MYKYYTWIDQLDNTEECQGYCATIITYNITQGTKVL